MSQINPTSLDYSQLERAIKLLAPYRCIHQSLAVTSQNSEHFFELAHHVAKACQLSKWKWTQLSPLASPLLKSIVQIALIRWSPRSGAAFVSLWYAYDYSASLARHIIDRNVRKSVVKLAQTVECMLYAYSLIEPKSVDKPVLHFLTLVAFGGKAVGHYNKGEWVDFLLRIGVATGYLVLAHDNAGAVLAGRGIYKLPGRLARQVSGLF